MAKLRERDREREKKRKKERELERKCDLQTNLVAIYGNLAIVAGEEGETLSVQVGRVGPDNRNV